MHDSALTPSLEQEELRGISRTVAEIQWLLLILVLLYYVFGVAMPYDQAAVAAALFFYAAFVMGFRYANFFSSESRWKMTLETLVMIVFITWALWHTGRSDSPLVNCYLLVIITSSLALGRVTTIAELLLIAGCFFVLGAGGGTGNIFAPSFIGGFFSRFAPFVLVAYVTTMFSSDIRYGLSKARLMAETDDLTNILNRRGFAIVADKLFGQAVRYMRPLSVLAVDCDNLKNVNDEMGHEAGDRLLKSIVQGVQGQLRSTDVLARYGGDEFVALLPETPMEGALDVAERIRGAIAASVLRLDGKDIVTTVSIGSATFPDQGRTLDMLLAQADRGMYQAKLAGRNRVNGRSV